MPTMKPYTPPLANTTWDSVYNPQQASIFDSTLEKVVRTLATITGINDPTQIPAALTTVTPAGPATGGLAKVIDDLVQKRQAIKAYHGSPHDFDKFSMDKIGVGEGAQAYGHGLYFAESEGVAKSYRDKLSGVSVVPEVSIDPAASTRLRLKAGEDFGTVEQYIRNAAKTSRGDLAEASRTLRESARQSLSAAEHFDSAYKARARQFARQAVTAARMIERGAVSLVENPGRMYEVAIKASPDDFLDWDKPLSQQSEKVRQGVATAAGVDVSRGPLASSPGRIAYEAIVGGRRAHGGFEPAPASGKLREAGVKGIKYLDAGSRAAGDGSRNYVVFDDKIIEILRKWGLLPFAVGAGAQQARTAEAK